MRKYRFCFLWIAFFFVVSCAYTQDHTIELLQQILSRQWGFYPEVLIMDPTYDSNHKLTGYSLGGVLKVDYWPHGAAYPEKKSVFVWNQFLDRWMEVGGSQYVYDDRMRLLSETIYQLGLEPHFRNEPVWQAHSIKKYSYQEENGKEVVQVELRHFSTSEIMVEDADTTCPTVEEYKEAEPEFTLAEVHDVVEYDVSEVKTDEEGGWYYSIFYTETRIFTGDGLLDTVVYSERGQEYMKMTWHYDEDQNPVRVTISSKDEEWRDYLNLHFSYQDNRVTYTLSGTDLFHTLFQNWEEELGDSEFDKGPYPALYRMYDGPLAFSFEFDPDQRLTSKTVALRKKPLLNVRYAYDTKGQQAVDATFDVASTLLFSGETVSEEILHQLRNLENMSYTVRYDKDAYRTSEFFIQEQGSRKSFKKAAITDKYDAEGRLLHYDFSRYDPEDSKERSRNLIIIDYGTEEGGITWREEATWHAIEKRENIYDNPLTRTLTKKDAQGRDIYVKKEFNYDKDTRRWSAGKISHTGYDENGYVSWEESEFYNNQKDCWENSRQKKMVNDALGRLLFVEWATWEKGAWKPKGRYRYAYDNYGNQTTEEEYIYSRNQWQGHIKTDQEYDSLGNILLTVRYLWPNDYGDWIPQTKEEINYYEYGKETINSNWQNGNWLPERKWYFSNREIPLKEKISQIWSWNASCADWQPERVYMEYETDKNTHVLENYKRYDDYGGIVGSKYEITTRTDTTSTVVYHFWNTKTDQWERILRYTRPVIEYLQEDTFLIELYDPVTGSWINEKKIYIRMGEEEIEGTGLVLYTTIAGWREEDQNWTEELYIRTVWESALVSGEAFRYHPESGEHTPFACFIKNNKEEGWPDGNLYSLWDTQTNSYQPFYIGYDYNYQNNGYYWDAVSNTWHYASDYQTAGDKNELWEQTYTLRTLFPVEPDKMIHTYFSKLPENFLYFRWD